MPGSAVKNIIHILLFCLTVLCAFQACKPVEPTAPVIRKWEQVNDPDLNLPAGIRLYAGENDRLPVKAWYLAVDLSAPEYSASAVVSDEADQRETSMSLADDLGALAVINGGYFRRELMPSRHVGLLKVDRQLIQPSINYVTRDDRKYFLTRAAIGLDNDGGVDLAWTFNRGDTLFEVQAPPAHMPGKPDSLFELTADYSLWNVDEAIGGGPMLVSGGKLHVTTNNEVFFGTSIPNVHPRSAYGYRTDGTLILLVVDGRQQASRGVDLNELAVLMLDLRCVEALNMDGGGSTTLIVNGKLINRPVGSTIQREVMSALAIFYHAESGQDQSAVQRTAIDELDH